MLATFLNWLLNTKLNYGKRCTMFDNQLLLNDQTSIHSCNKQTQMTNNTP